jgi:hypothetical protein
MLRHGKRRERPAVVAAFARPTGIQRKADLISPKARLTKHPQTVNTKERVA